MSIRSVKFVPALFAGVVAGGNLATTTDLRAQVLTTSAEAAIQAPQVAADSCLSAPKGATPAGSHWYYRLDRVTKRQCWYLREEGDAADDKFARAAPPASAPRIRSNAAADEPAPQQRTASRKSISDKSISDARAEWQPRAEVNPPARVERTAATVAPAPVVSNSQRAAMPNVLTPAPLSSMRWNDASPTRASVNPADIQLAAATPPAAQPPQSDEVQQPAADQVVTRRRSGRGAGKADRLAAETVDRDGRRPGAGRPHGQRDRADRPDAGTPRHAAQASRDVGFQDRKDREDEAACPATQQPQPTLRDEDAVVRRAAAAQQHARVPAGKGTDAPAPGAAASARGAAIRTAGTAACAAGSRAPGRMPQDRASGPLAAGSRPP